MSITDSPDYMFELLLPYLDRDSVVKLSQTCSSFYNLFRTLLNGREIWEKIDLHDEQSVGKIMISGNRFIRRSDENKIYRLINFKHKIEPEYLEDGIRYSLSLYLIHIGWKVMYFSKTERYDKSVLEIEYLKFSPAKCVIRPIHNED